ncbi:MAG: TonB-dependent receptor [Methyloglobulus sp.]|nr:TonB-dependent receptor [Methyloglobulus sp.]
MPTFFKHQIFLMLTVAIVLSWPALSHADNTGIRQYQLSPQPLANALRSLGLQSGLQLFYPSELVAGKTTKGIKGRYAPEQALSWLLQGTGVTYKLKDANTVTLQKEAAPAKLIPVADTQEPQSNSGEGQVMPKVTVEADAEQAFDPEYYADPYNKDYVIPNATAGTKTNTPIMETPLNVQVISKQVLKERQAFRLSDALKNVSGVRTNANNVTGLQKGGSFGLFGGSDETLILRGFDSQTFFRNGFRLTEGAASKGFANVESVEVLKGPAAILYGLVEPGGMVNVTTKQPLATPYYGFTQQFGSFDLFRTTFDATGPLTKNKDLLYRVNMSYENSGSFRQFVGNENVFFTPVLQWNISPQTQATFEVEYSRIHRGLDNGFLPTSSVSSLPFDSYRNYGEYSPGVDETIFGSLRWQHQFNDDWLLKHNFSVNRRGTDNKMAYPLNAGSKADLLVWSGGDNFLANLPNQDYVMLENIRQSAQLNTYATNIDLVGHFDTWGLKHTLLLGGDYYRLDSNSAFTYLEAPNTFGVTYLPLNPVRHPALVPPGLKEAVRFGPGETTTDQYGLYIQDQIKLPYDLHVTGGIRWQYIHDNVVFKNVDGSVGSSSASTNDAVTPRVGILWSPKSWLSLYANYAESFGSNIDPANGVSLSFVNNGVGKALGPTSAEQYEGGIKLSFFDNRLRATLAYYDLTKTNVAVGDPDITHNCGTGNFAPGEASDCKVALGKVRSRGPELDITGEILPGWNVIATWTNTDIKVIKTDPSGKDLGGGLFPGARLPGAVRNTGSFWSTYEIQDGDFQGLQFGGGVNLTGRKLGSYAQFEDNKPPITPGYATVDLMAGYSRKLGDMTVSAQLNINNLLDEQYYSDIQAFPSRIGSDKYLRSTVSYGEPRMFMGQISIQY